MFGEFFGHQSLKIIKLAVFRLNLIKKPGQFPGQTGGLIGGWFFTAMIRPGHDQAGQQQFALQIGDGWRQIKGSLLPTGTINRQFILVRLAEWSNGRQ